MSRFALLDAWMHDAPTNVVRLPVFPLATPARLVAEACVKFNRVALMNKRNNMIWLAKERT